MKEIFSFKGNAGRLDFLGCQLFAALILGSAGFLAGLAEDVANITAMPGFLLLGFLIIGFWILLATSARRLNDLQRTRWVLLLFGVPFVSMLTFLYLLLAPSWDPTRGRNRIQRDRSNNDASWNDLSEFKS
ncbi:DUF805 domain-containing protein [Arenicellales bacterium IMCC55707]